MMQDKSKKYRLIFDSVLGFAIGDALGVPIEFTSRKSLELNPLKEMVGYGSHKVPEGTWSDDSSMLLATMDSITEKGKIDYDDIMRKFCDWYINSKYTATGITFDIGVSTRTALTKFYKGVPALKCGGKGEFDNGNGSLMRILPIVLYSYFKDFNEEEEIKLLNEISSLTHAHEISKLGCKIYCDYVKLLINGYDKTESLKKLKFNNYNKYYSNVAISKYKNILDGNLREVNYDNIKSSGYVVDTLEASIWSVLKTNSYEEAVLKAINLGDDTDTVGAITGSLAGIIYGYENIPKKWIEKLKNRDYLVNLINEYSNSFYKNELVTEQKKLDR